MSPSSTGRSFAPYAVCIASMAVVLTGCASTRPIAYSDLASASKLRPNTQDRSGRMPFSYSEPVDWRQYNQVIIEPVAVYRGADAQFKKISEEDKNELAQYMQKEFTERLSEQFRVVKTGSSNTLDRKSVV